MAVSLNARQEQAYRCLQVLKGGERLTFDPLLGRAILPGVRWVDRSVFYHLKAKDWIHLVGHDRDRGVDLYTITLRGMGMASAFDPSEMGCIPDRDWPQVGT